MKLFPRKAKKKKSIDDIARGGGAANADPMLTVMAMVPVNDEAASDTENKKYVSLQQRQGGGGTRPSGAELDNSMTKGQSSKKEGEEEEADAIITAAAQLLAQVKDEVMDAQAELEEAIAAAEGIEAQEVELEATKPEPLKPSKAKPAKKSKTPNKSPTKSGKRGGKKSKKKSAAADSEAAAAAIATAASDEKIKVKVASLEAAAAKKKAKKRSKSKTPTKKASAKKDDNKESSSPIEEKDAAAAVTAEEEVPFPAAAAMVGSDKKKSKKQKKTAAKGGKKDKKEITVAAAKRTKSPLKQRAASRGRASATDRKTPTFNNTTKDKSSSRSKSTGKKTTNTPTKSRGMPRTRSLSRPLSRGRSKSASKPKSPGGKSPRKASGMMKNRLSIGTASAKNSMASSIGDDIASPKSICTAKIDNRKISKQQQQPSKIREMLKEAKKEDTEKDGYRLTPLMSGISEMNSGDSEDSGIADASLPSAKSAARGGTTNFLTEFDPCCSPIEKQFAPDTRHDKRHNNVDVVVEDEPEGDGWFSHVCGGGSAWKEDEQDERGAANDLKDSVDEATDIVEEMVAVVRGRSKKIEKRIGWGDDATYDTTLGESMHNDDETTSFQSHGNDTYTTMSNGNLTYESSYTQGSCSTDFMASMDSRTVGSSTTGGCSRTTGTSASGGTFDTYGDASSRSASTAPSASASLDEVVSAAPLPPAPEEEKQQTPSLSTKSKSSKELPRFSKLEKKLADSDMKSLRNSPSPARMLDRLQSRSTPLAANDLPTQLNVTTPIPTDAAASPSKPSDNNRKSPTPFSRSKRSFTRNRSNSPMIELKSLIRRPKTPDMNKYVTGSSQQESVSPSLTKSRVKGIVSMLPRSRTLTPTLPTITAANGEDQPQARAQSVPIEQLSSPPPSAAMKKVRSVTPVSIKSVKRTIVDKYMASSRDVQQQHDTTEHISAVIAAAVVAHATQPTTGIPDKRTSDPRTFKSNQSSYMSRRSTSHRVSPKLFDRMLAKTNKAGSRPSTPNTNLAGARMVPHPQSVHSGDEGEEVGPEQEREALPPKCTLVTGKNDRSVELSAEGRDDDLAPSIFDGIAAAVESEQRDDADQVSVATVFTDTLLLQAEELLNV